MKASEMTNEELANECESVAASMEKYGGRGCGVKLREAAARLRKQGEIIKMAHVETRIAAAPDLYDALLEALPWLADIGAEVVGNEAAAKIAAVVKKAEAALAKASGEGEVGK